MPVVTKLDRLARPLPGARDIADELTAREIKLNLGGAVHAEDPLGRLLLNVLAYRWPYRRAVPECRCVARSAGWLATSWPTRHEATEPDALWQADHTEPDIQIVDADGTLGCPWPTLIIDNGPRAVAGYSLFLGAPSALRWPRGRAFRP